MHRIVCWQPAERERHKNSISRASSSSFASLLALAHTPSSCLAHRCIPNLNLNLNSTKLFSEPQRMDQSQRFNLFLIDMPISMLMGRQAQHLFTLHHSLAIINVSSSFLIDMPISMLSMAVTKHLFTMHHRTAVINASRSFLIDMPISMLETKTTMQLFTLHHRTAVINASSSFLIDMPTSMHLAR